VLTQFNLNNKIITLVIDGEENMIKAIRYIKINRVPCVAQMDSTI